MALQGDSAYLGSNREPLLATNPEESETRRGCIDRLKNGFKEWGFSACELAKRNARNGIFSVKMGMALALVSLLMFTDVSDSQGISWAMFTVVVVFEFTVGATLRKGFNRGLGTLAAGGLALAVAAFASHAGKLEDSIFIISIFITGSLATFAKLYPTLLSYEYCFTVVLLTFCYILDSGTKTGEFLGTAYARILLIGIGAAITLGVNACIYPIWAGEDLHKLIVKNFMNLADSIEEYVNDYLSVQELKRFSSEVMTWQAAQDPLFKGYSSALLSATSEETLEGFARWEPPHGCYKKMNYPWMEFVKVGGALRHSASVALTLHGCTLSEIQPSLKLRTVFRDDLNRVSSEAAKVLREVGHNMENMTKLKHGDILERVKAAAMDLQRKLNSRSHLFVHSEGWLMDYHNNEAIMKATQRGRSQSESNLPVYSRRDGGNCRVQRTNISCSEISAVSKEIAECNEPIWKLGPEQQSWSSKYNNDNASESESSPAQLSLATFASLLIEFVARLDNVVNCFQLLSESAKFKVQRACRQFMLKSSRGVAVAIASVK